MSGSEGSLVESIASRDSENPRALWDGLFFRALNLKKKTS